MATFTLDAQAFQKLLAALDTDAVVAGAKYEHHRKALIRYFRSWGSPEAEELADKTIDRVARRILEGEEIWNPGGYFLGTARRIRLEETKRKPIIADGRNLAVEHDNQE